MTGHWILCVDDEPKVLSGLELQLGLDHAVRTATGGAEGLELLTAHPDCAVVLSDMRMPSMNGAQFLAEVRSVSPDSTRMLLTGYSDMGDAIAAVNDGGIFRFLTKPCGPEMLTVAMADAIRQWELVRSERVLLEQTLSGAAKALIEALEIASPEVFSRARRIEALCRHVSTTLRVGRRWEVALAGLLLRLGWIAIPAETVNRHLAGGRLDEGEAEMFEAAYATSARLVGRIPRLDGVAAIIGAAHQPSGAVDSATIVRTIAEFDRLCHDGTRPTGALHALDGTYPSEILDAIGSWAGIVDQIDTREFTVSQLHPGMVAEQDILTTTGGLLVQSGTELTETLIHRLANFAARQGVNQPITVSLPRS